MVGCFDDYNNRVHSHGLSIASLVAAQHGLVGLSRISQYRAPYYLTHLKTLLFNILSVLVIISFLYVIIAWSASVFCL
jgi:hypothetical protein